MSAIVSRDLVADKACCHGTTPGQSDKQGVLPVNHIYLRMTNILTLSQQQCTGDDQNTPTKET